MPNSQGSVPSSPIEDCQITNGDILLSSSSGEESVDEAISGKNGADDKILRRFSSKYSSAHNDVVKKRKHSSNDDEPIRLQQFDLGRHYDPEITNSIEKISDLREQMKTSPATKETNSEASKRAEVRKFLKKPNVNNVYIDMILKETVSCKYVDWHFVTENSTFVEDDFSALNSISSSKASKKLSSSLEEVIRSFGVKDLTIKALFNNEKPISKLRHFDTLCEIAPIDAMMDTLLKYNDKSDAFIKIFICFVLDRKIYDSIDCDVIWCTEVFETLPIERFVTCYFQLVRDTDYFMHYRMIRLIPSIQSELLEFIFRNDLLGASAEIMITQFDILLDKEQYEALLYYVLFVFGCEEMPYGFSKCMKHFDLRMFHLVDSKTSAVELRLLKGILSLFMKI